MISYRHCTNDFIIINSYIHLIIIYMIFYILNTGVTSDYPQRRIFFIFKCLAYYSVKIVYQIEFFNFSKFYFSVHNFPPKKPYTLKK